MSTVTTVVQMVSVEEQLKPPSHSNGIMDVLSTQLAYWVEHVT